MIWMNEKTRALRLPWNPRRRGSATAALRISGSATAALHRRPHQYKILTNIKNVDFSKINTEC